MTWRDLGDLVVASSWWDFSIAQRTRRLAVSLSCRPHPSTVPLPSSPQLNPAAPTPPTATHIEYRGLANNASHPKKRPSLNRKNHHTLKKTQRDFFSGSAEPLFPCAATRDIVVQVPHYPIWRRNFMRRSLVLTM